MVISRVDLEPVVVGELQSARYKLEVARKIDVDGYIRILMFGFYSLYYPIGKKGVALQLKPVVAQVRKHAPDWILQLFGWLGKDDYDMSEYDTGDPIELAMKILAGWTLSWKYIIGRTKPGRHDVFYDGDRFETIFNISRQIILDGIEDRADGAFETAAVWAALLSWQGYGFDVSDVVDLIKANVPYGTNYFIDFVIYGRGDVMSRVVMNDYRSWVPLKENIRG